MVQRFQELFAQMKYKEAAELAADSPQGVLRTPDTVAKFQVNTLNPPRPWTMYGFSSYPHNEPPPPKAHTLQ